MIICSHRTLKGLLHKLSLLWPEMFVCYQVGCLAQLWCSNLCKLKKKTETWSYTGVLSTYIQHESNLEKSCVLKGVGLGLPGLPGTQSLRFVADIIFCNYHTSFFTSTRNNEGVQHSPFSSYSLQPKTTDTQWGLKPKKNWNVWAEHGRHSAPAIAMILNIIKRAR